MKMRHTYMLVIVAIGLSGCYKVTVETGAPAAATVIERPWQMSFAAGLVPPPAIETQVDCPQGIATVETQRSFLNSLAAAVTSSIITPMDVRVTCAQGPVP
jgi:hypothetical protein